MRNVAHEARQISCFCCCSKNNFLHFIVAKRKP